MKLLLDVLALTVILLFTLAIIFIVVTVIISSWQLFLFVGGVFGFAILLMASIERLG